MHSCLLLKRLFPVVLPCFPPIRTYEFYQYVHLTDVEMRVVVESIDEMRFFEGSVLCIPS